MSYKILKKDVIFEKLSEEHRIPVIDVLNYYVEHEVSAYPEEKLNYDYYENLLNIANKYPAYAIKVMNKVVGFCFLNAYHVLSSFKGTATITYFIDKEYVGKGIGKNALTKLENDAKSNGIKILLANIASVNERSLIFHSKNGFFKCGEFKNILQKKNKEYSIVWMQKTLI